MEKKTLTVEEFKLACISDDKLTDEQVEILMNMVVLNSEEDVLEFCAILHKYRPALEEKFATEIIEKKMEQYGVCVPPENRVPNRVDKLNLQIRQIRQNCKHAFRLIKKPKMQESLVHGVIAYEKGPHTLAGYSDPLVLACLHCSEKKEATIIEICPRCLGKMGKEPFCLGVDSRKEYFGCDHLYYVVRLYRCQDCGLTVASEEWNQ